MSSRRNKLDHVGGKNTDQSWLGCVTVSVVLGALAIAALLCVLVSCSPKIVERVVEREKVVYKDTTCWRDTTIYVPLPLEAGKVITTAKDTAAAETSIARAESFVDTTGYLHLALWNKKEVLPYHLAIPSRMIWIEVTRESEQMKPQIIEVDKPLSWWQKFRIGAFWWLLGAVVLLLLWTFRKLIF